METIGNSVRFQICLSSAMITLLMGDDVEPRREYIEKHAAGVKDLDI